MRTSAKLITALSVAGLAVAAGSAFTAANTINGTAPKTGYATTAVTGATATSLTYNLNGAGDTITSATLVLAGDTSASNVLMNYNGGTAFTCGVGTVDEIDNTTTYTCTQSQSTSGLMSTAVIVN